MTSASSGWQMTQAAWAGAFYLLYLCHSAWLTPWWSQVKCFVRHAASENRRAGRAIYEKRADVQLKLVACFAFIDPESRPLLARSWPNLPSTDFFYVAWG